MSRQISAKASLPVAPDSTPATILAALTAGLSELEANALEVGTRPIWDTVSIYTETDWSQDYTDGDNTLRRALSINATAVLPEEVEE